MNREMIEYTIWRLTEISLSDAKTEMFDMAHWANKAIVHPPDQPLAEHKCGFAGCYLGWAIHEQWYTTKGLHLDFWVEEKKDLVGMQVLEEGTEVRFHQFVRMPQDRLTTNTVSAVAYLHGINRETLEKVIYEENYAGYYDDDGKVHVLDVIERWKLLLEMGEFDFVRMVNKERGNLEGA